jgi:hypothetical protein
MRGRRWWRFSPVLLVAALGGCSALVARRDADRADFFPLTPQSHWEYVVSDGHGSQRFRFLATVRQNPFVDPDGRPCRVVDERYTDISAEETVPVLYCVEGGFLHRVMSLEYRGEQLQDNGLRSGELKFLPTHLTRDSTWQGFTNAYRLPDGSGYVVEQLHHSTAATEQVSVPAGRFGGCMRVDTTAVHYALSPEGEPVGKRVTFYYADWYAPGIGLVKTEQRNAQSEVLAMIELDRYDIGGEAPFR